MPPPKAPGGKQRTISSFFTPKQQQQQQQQQPLASAIPKPKEPAVTAVQNKNGTPPPPPVPAITKTAENGKEAVPVAKESDDDDGDDEVPVSRMRRKSSKRTLAEKDNQETGGESDDDELYSLPTKKRKKLRRHNDDSEAGAAARSSPVPTTAQKKQAVSPPPPPQIPTTRYRYDPGGEKMDVDTAVAVDPERTKQKKKLREQFVKKLGRVEMFAAGSREEGEDGETAADEEEEEEPELGPIAKRFGKGKAAVKPAAKKGGGLKLTPLEKQVVQIKLAHPDTVLVVEVGYKFRFFGEDARIASQNLSIMCIPGKMRFDNHPSEAHYDRFASASIPVPRLHVHVKRLVSAGYKVGVVRQLETAALKAAGDNRNAPFERKLTNLYTKGTYIDDVDGLEGGDLSSGAGSGGAPNTGFLLAITEKPGGGSGADEKVHVGIVAVQPSTGEVVYDEFDDGFMRSELETRLLHIAPCEFLIVGELTKATEKIVSHLASSTTTVFGDKVRVERVERTKSAHTEAAAHVSKFYADKVQFTGSSEAEGKNKLLDTVLDLSQLVTICLSAMIRHLTDYGLEHVFDLTKYFQSFSGRSHMLLNGNTLSSLEIYRNQTDYTTKGSLFWTLDRTKTKFGRRLLRNWVGRPLLDRHQLEERLKAVEEMAKGDKPKLDSLKELLGKVSYDLEKGLIRIYYGKCTRPELLAILQTMLRIANAFQPVDDPKEVGFQSDIINKAIAALPGIREDVSKFLGVFNHRAAGKDDKYDFFKENNDEENPEYEAIMEHKLGISAVEADLIEHKQEICQTLKRKVGYMTVSGIEYLVEVANDKSSLNKVPASWVKISGTKKVARFHTPRVITMLRERDQHKESLAAACDKAFKSFLHQISQEYQQFRDSIHSLATLDCLFSLATVANQPDYVKPVFTEDTVIDVREGRHPMVEQLLLDAYVPNSISLSPTSTRAMLITGPNMGGKSSFVRQTALISIMAQIGSYVPAESARLGLLDAVFTRMGAFDNMMAGESTFMVELSETSDILKAATARSLVILDELGRGTSTHDGVAIAHAVFDHVVREKRSLLLFVTHYPLLARFAETYPGTVENTHMAFEESGDDGENVTFLYRVAKGVAHRSYGLNVARLAGLPGGVLQTAGVKSRELEEEMRGREAVRWAKAVKGVVEGDDDDVDVEGLVRSLEV